MSRAVIMCSWDEVPHLSESDKQRLTSSLPPHQQDARIKGIPSLGAGAIYPISEEEIMIEPFQMPRYYPRIYGLDVGWNKTAAIWGAHDLDADILYLYSEHYRGKAEPSVHSTSIKARGNWIPGEIDPAAAGSGQKDGEKLIEIYEGEGLHLNKANNVVEAGIYAVYERLCTGRLKVFSTLQSWFKEYRLYRRNEDGKIVKENDHAMDATRYLVMGIQNAIVQPIPKNHQPYRPADPVTGY